jgi:hypothetical protein
MKWQEAGKDFTLRSVHHLYEPPNIVRVIKSKRMRWASHVACMGAIRCAYEILVRKPEGSRPLRRASY